jgi:hypothetical protein
MTEWDVRMLCPDGGCVGLIGHDGLCKVCGRAAPNWGDERTRGIDSGPVEKQDPDDDDDGDDDDHDLKPLLPGTPAEIGEWAERQVCSDGGCIGVINTEGVCNVCGKPAEAA